MNQLKTCQLIWYRTSNIGSKGLPCNLDSLLRFQLSSWSLVSTAWEAVHDYTFSRAGAPSGPGAARRCRHSGPATGPRVLASLPLLFNVLKGLPCSYRYFKAKETSRIVPLLKFLFDFIYSAGLRVPWARVFVSLLQYFFKSLTLFLYKQKSEF